MSEVRVEELWCYPIKSCAGVLLERAVVGETGFELDREFMLVDENNAFLTQRCHPELARVALAVESDHLGVSIPGFGESEIATDYSSDLPQVEMEVHKKPAVGLDQGDEAADIFRRFLRQPVRLLRASREHPRYVSEPYRRDDTTNRVAFGDAFPYLLTSRASLHELHNRTGLKYGDVPMNRFRPSIVVDGPELEPFAEDRWKRIRVGKLDAFIVRACDRCKIPSIIQTEDTAGDEGEIAVKATFLESRAGLDMANPNHPTGRFFGQNLNLARSSVGRVIKTRDMLELKEIGMPNIELRTA